MGPARGVGVVPESPAFHGPASHEAGYAASSGGRLETAASFRAYTTQPARYFSRVSHLLLPPLANLFRSGFHVAFAP